MTCEVRQEIAAAITRGGLTSRVHALDEGEARRVVEKIEVHLVKGMPRVWWLSLRHGVLWGVPEEAGHHQIRRRLGADTPCLFVPDLEDAEGAVFTADVDAALRVVMDCRFFEYYIVARDFGWIVGENDHNAVFGSVAPTASGVPPGLVEWRAAERHAK